MDLRVPTSPLGFGPDRVAWPVGYLATFLRRSTGGSWYQPFLTIVPPQREDGTRRPRRPQALGFVFTGSAYVATFRAAESGGVSLWVNDAVVPWRGAVMPWLGLTGDHYGNNHGTAAVEIRELP